MREIKVKSLLNKHKKRDSCFLDDYTLNPYAGCSMGCIYCYTRGSKYGARQTPENVTNMDVALKADAASILKRQLKNRLRRGERGFIVLGSAAEAYPNVENDLKVTREILGLIKRFKFPVHVCTRSKLVLRDLDLLRAVNETAVLPDDLDYLEHGVFISFSFSTLDEGLARLLEPGAPSPQERLETMKKCSVAGFKVGVINMPVLPFLSDSDESLEAMVKSAKEHGASYVMFAALTLFGNGPEDCRTLYYKFLEDNYPELIPEYQKLFRNSSYPSNTYQKDLSRRAKKVSDKYNIKTRIL
ncbi:SPL family radical SAM protein [Methanobacterium congolense]|uniref:SPL family radical SAM protein n=1 Tax=Methanobacterium congolense TaxID=118062 RepID=UPI001E59CC01|nr:radical SAM protein [Methanobacterium congolense]